MPVRLHTHTHTHTYTHMTHNVLIPHSCTGYRPILDAARLFGSDSSAPESASLRAALRERPAKRSELAFPAKLTVRA